MFESGDNPQEHSETYLRSSKRREQETGRNYSHPQSFQLTD